MLIEIGGKEIALDLISILLVQPATRPLRSKIGVGSLKLDVVSLEDRVFSNQLSITLIRPLLKLVVSRRSDAEVWAALYDLVLQANLTLPRPTTPDRPSIASLFQGTPNSYKSGSLQNTFMPIERVKEALKFELNSSIELNHPNFIATFFKDRQVEDAANAVFKKCCEGEAPVFKNRWHAWEDDEEPDVQRSFENNIKFIMTFLDSANIKPPGKRQFLPSPNTKHLGTEKLKPDICLANGATRLPSWGQVLVPIEVKAPGRDGWERTWLDIAKYARAILSYQDSRRFVLGITLCGSTMRLWEFDRLGATTSEAFDIHENGRLFVKILLSFLWMNDEQLGFDPDLMEVDSQRFVKVNKDGKEERLIITETLGIHSWYVAGQAATCWKAYRYGDDSKKPLVIKDSWQDVTRPEEGELIRKATVAGAVNISQHYHHETVWFAGKQDSIRTNIRSGLPAKDSSNPFAQAEPSSPEQTRSSSFSQMNALQRSRKRPRSTMAVQEGENVITLDRVRRRVITRNLGKSLRKASCLAAILTGVLGGIKGESIRLSLLFVDETEDHRP